MAMSMATELALAFPVLLSPFPAPVLLTTTMKKKLDPTARCRLAERSLTGLASRSRQTRTASTGGDTHIEGA